MNFHTQAECNTTDPYWRAEHSSSQLYNREPAVPPNAHNINTLPSVHHYSNGPYAYPSSEQFVPYINNIDTATSPQTSPISNPDFSPYSAVEQYEETSSAYAEEGISRYPPQVAEYQDYSHVSFQNDTNSLELVHSYRRIPIADEFDYLNVNSPSSSKKKLGVQIPANRQQLTAKFECIACHARFSYESSAKRHQLNQVKRFKCNVCNQKFARVDYRNWHQRRCETGFRLSDVEKLPG